MFVRVGPLPDLGVNANPPFSRAICPTFDFMQQANERYSQEDQNSALRLPQFYQQEP